MSNIKNEYQGAKGLRAISELTGIPKPTLHQRIYRLGMTVEEAVNHQKGIYVKKSSMNTKASLDWLRFLVNTECRYERFIPELSAKE